MGGMPQLEYILKGVKTTHPASYHHGDPSSAQTGVVAKFILQGSAGVTVILGQTDDKLCPVAAITGYMVW